jgi:hypothetical protein
MPWEAPPRGQASRPFGSPSFRTPLLRPTTSTPPTVRQAYIKIGFRGLLDYFAFLTCSFTCVSERPRITTKRRAGIRLRQHSLEHGGRIRQQWQDVIVLVSFVFKIVLTCQTYCFTFVCRDLYCLTVVYDMLYILPVLKATRLERQSK